MDSKFDYLKIADITKNCELFKKIIDEQGDDKIHIAWCKAMKVVSYIPGQNIISLGEPAGDFYVIIEGKVSVRIPNGKSRSPRVEENKQDLRKKFGSFIGTHDKTIGVVLVNKFLGHDLHDEVKILSKGDVFGELAMINEKPRAYAVTAKSKVLLGVLKKEAFHRLLSHYAERTINDKVDFLQCLPIFKSWSRNYLMKICFYFTPKKLAWNQVLYRESSQCNFVYFVKTGDIMVMNKKLTQSINPDAKKSFNKHFKQFAHQVDLKLVKKSRGMILGIEEVLAGEKLMRHTARCSSAVAELYVLSRSDFDLKIMKPEFVNTIRENYRQDQEFIKNRYISSCLTERAKLGIGKFEFEGKKKTVITTRRRVDSKISQARTSSALSGEPARILYSNRRAGSIELYDGEKITKMSVCMSNPSFENGFKPSESIFKTNLMNEDYE